MVHQIRRGGSDIQSDAWAIPPAATEEPTQNRNRTVELLGGCIPEVLQLHHRTVLGFALFSGLQEGKDLQCLGGRHGDRAAFEELGDLGGKALIPDVLVVRRDDAVDRDAEP